MRQGAEKSYFNAEISQKQLFNAAQYGNTALNGNAAPAISVSLAQNLAQGGIVAAVHLFYGHL
jgi:hypothetical protein